MGRRAVIPRLRKNGKHWRAKSCRRLDPTANPSREKNAKLYSRHGRNKNAAQISRRQLEYKSEEEAREEDHRDWVARKPRKPAR